MSSFKTGTIDASNIDLDSDEFDFTVDTAGSWDGHFPSPATGDYLVTIKDIDLFTQQVLVSRRYTEATDADNAAELALSAFCERHDRETDDNGDPLPVANPFNGSDETVIPCFVASVDAVTGESDDEE